jgi:hypothetical protein
MTNATQSSGKAHTAARQPEGPVPQDISVPGLGLVATIWRRTDNGPMRALRSGRQANPVGRYPSKKMGCALPYESPGELHGFYEAEADVNVIRYYAQPHTITMMMADEWVNYTPDRLEILADGTTSINEMKGLLNWKRDPLYQAKLERARLHYESRHWQFRISERAEVEALPRFKVAEYIQAYRRTSITAHDLLLMRMLFGDCESICLPAALCRYPSRAVGLSKISAMVVRRLIGLDLDQGFSDDSRLWRIRL